MSHLQAVVLTRDVNHPGICWKDNTAGHKHYRRFLEIPAENSLFQVTEEPARRGALFDLILNKELVGYLEIKGSLGLNDLHRCLPTQDLMRFLDAVTMR